MKPWLRWSLVAGVLLAFLIIFLRVEPTQSPQSTSAPESKEKPTGPSTEKAVSSPAAPESQSHSPAPLTQKSIPRMLELGSVGCRPCDMMAPIIEALRQEYNGKLAVEFYDVRKDPEPARQYRIRVIPTQIFIDASGKEIFRHEGFLPKEEILPVLAQMGVK